MDWIVFGLGKSATFMSKSQALHYNTIGVNDIDKYHDVDHLVIPDKWERFTEDRLKIIAATTAHTVWLKECRCFLGLETHPDIRYYKLSCAWSAAQFDEEFKIGGERIPYSYTSPFLAAVIAWKYLRAERIGILGMDVLPDHHMNKNLIHVDHDFKMLREALLKRGTELVNLSHISKVKSLPLMSWDFIRRKTQ